MGYILELDWESTPYFRKKYAGRLSPRGGGMYYYEGVTVPSDLKPYLTEDFSYARWVEDDYRLKAKTGRLPTRVAKTQFTPRPHQREGAKKIYLSWTRGDSGFLLASKTGTGKTLTSVVALTAMAKKSGFNNDNPAKVLVVCPKSVIPVWRQTLQSYGASKKYMRIMVINYQQLNKLLNAPPAPKTKKGRKKRRQSTRMKNKTTALRGTPKIDFDYIVFDESHYLKNYGSSNMSFAAVNIAKLEQRYMKGKQPYVIFSTATPGSTPLHFTVLSKIVAPLLNISSGKTVTPSTWGAFLQKQGFDVKEGKTGWTWATVSSWYNKNSDDPAARAKYEQEMKSKKRIQRRDSQRIGKSLLKPNAPFLMQSPKDIAGWPEQQITPLPIELTRKQQPVYEEAWTRFRNWMKLTPARSDPKGALVENLRYRQKSSMLKVEQLAEFIEELVESEKQVYVSAEFIEDIDKLKELLEKKKIPVSEISGRNVTERERERLRFQKGETKVVVSTVVAGVSFHAGETLPDGTKATSNERVTVVLSIRENNLDTEQALGRAHRDGQNSIAYIPFFVGTIDEKVVNSFTNKTANMNSMMGKNSEEAGQLETIFREALADF